MKNFKKKIEKLKKKIVDRNFKRATCKGLKVNDKNTNNNKGRQNETI